MNDRLMEVGDVARAHGVSRTWVRYLTDVGIIPAIRTTRGVRLYREADVRAALETRAKRGAGLAPERSEP